MTTTYIPIEYLTENRFMPPLQKVVEEKSIPDLIEICNDGDKHAYVASWENLGDSLRIVTLFTRSEEKWHELRAWAPTC